MPRKSGYGGRKMRSFRKTGKAKRRSDGDSLSAHGANSQGGRRTRPVSINRDQSSGIKRERSPRRLD